MSMLITLTQETGTLLSLAPPVPAQDGLRALALQLPAQEGITDWMTVKNAAVQLLARGISITVAMVFVMVVMVVSKFSLGRILVSGITAGVGVWIVFNVTGLEDRVDNEVGAGPGVVIAAPSGAAPGEFDLVLQEVTDGA